MFVCVSLSCLRIQPPRVFFFSQELVQVLGGSMYLFFPSESFFCGLQQTVPLPAQGPLRLSPGCPCLLGGRDWLPPPSQPQQGAGPKV